MKNKKGFTLIELLVVIVIIGLLIGVGIISFSSIFGQTEKNYYKVLEDNALMSANDYFIDHRDMLPVSDYSEVSIASLINGKYLNQLKDKSGNECSGGKVYVYRDNDGNYQYEVCLKCGDYESTGLYCDGTNLRTIRILAKSSVSNKNYEVLYENPRELYDENALVTFEMGNDINLKKYEISDINNNLIAVCDTINNNQCTKEITSSGTYKVNAYDSSGNKVGNERKFYVAISSNAPSFTIVAQKKYIIEDNSTTKQIEFRIDNVFQTISKAEYRIKRPGNDGTFKSFNSYLIRENVESGYDFVLEVKLTNSGNKYKVEQHQFDVSYLIDLDYNDGKKDVFEVINGKKYGELNKLPDRYNNKKAKWLYNGNIVTDDTVVTLNKRHTLSLKKYEIVNSNNLTENCLPVTYNGKLQNLTLDQNNYFTFTNNKGTDAKAYSVKVNLKDEYMWEDETLEEKTISCSIAPRNIAVKANNQSKIYDGTALKADDTCSLISGTLPSGYSVSCSGNTGSQTVTGSSTKTLGIVTIKNNSGNDVSSNFNITKDDGLLTVGKKTITVMAIDQSKEYDGTALKADDTCIGIGQLLVHMITCSNNTGEITNAGSITKSIGTVVIKTEITETDVTNNYEIVKEDGTLTINKKLVTVKASNQSKDYDGNTLIADNSCTISGQVPGHSVSCDNNIGSITDAGSTPKTLGNVTILDGSSDVTNNYYINKENGTLTVNRSKSATTGSCRLLTYNAGSQTLASGATNASYIDNSGINAGDYDVTVKANNNYSFEDGETTKKLSCKIEFVSVEVPTCGTKDLGYGSQVLFAAHTSGAYTNSQVSGTNPGEYSTTLYLSSNYKWSDGTRDDKTIICKIRQCGPGGEYIEYKGIHYCFFGINAYSQKTCQDRGQYWIEGVCHWHRCCPGTIEFNSKSKCAYYTGGINNCN